MAQLERAGSWLSEAAVVHFAQRLAPRLRAGDALALVGTMGAGKTTFSRALCEALGVDVSETFGSPTYAYANIYEAPHFSIVHADLARLDTVGQAEALGIAEQVRDPEALVIVEWADKLPTLVADDAVWLQLAVDWERPTQRTFVLRGPHNKMASYADALP